MLSTSTRADLAGWCAPRAEPTLGDREIHVWRVELPSAGPAPEEPLSADERERAQTFKFAVDRTRWVSARTALRLVLSRYLPRRAADLTLLDGPRGKPRLVGSADVEWLRFNASHSAEVALIAVTRGCEVGVDIERVREVPELLDVARRVFDREHLRSLERTSGHEQLEAFFEGWCRHEARTKCDGTGLADATVEPSEHAPVVFDLPVAPAFAGALAASCVPEILHLWDFPGW